MALAALGITGSTYAGLDFESPLKTEDINIRDPFIYADQQSKTYYLYAESGNYDGQYTGVQVYLSKDLIRWSKPRPVMEYPEKDSDILWVWAPEMHKFNGTYYLFVTLTFKTELPEKQPVEVGKWPDMHIRGTHIFRANNPLGPFNQVKTTSHTPADWMALDGTLFVENGKPYMVFCHEWVQIIDGTIDYIQLKDDLSDTVGKPQLMFKASCAPGAEPSPKAGKITDGCFFYRSPLSNRLFMIWSTHIPGKGYCVVLTHSESGKLRGPWQEQELLYTQDGGHGMIFSTFNDRLMMAIHQPNVRRKERLRLFVITDNGMSLTVNKEEKLP